MAELLIVHNWHITWDWPNISEIKWLLHSDQIVIPFISLSSMFSSPFLCSSLHLWNLFLSLKSQQLYFPAHCYLSLKPVYHPGCACLFISYLLTRGSCCLVLKYLAVSSICLGLLGLGKFYCFLMENAMESQLTPGLGSNISLFGEEKSRDHW